jgi:Fe-S-cluster containining protein
MTNARPAICAACGDCCRPRPGAEEPGRFLAAPDPAAALARALSSGDRVLARLAGIRYLRPATVAERATGSVHEGAEASPCVFLEQAGCRLPFADRPRMCRELEPWANGDCQAGWDLPQAGQAWAPCQGLIEDAVRQLRFAADLPSRIGSRGRPPR